MTSRYNTETVSGNREKSMKSKDNSQCSYPRMFLGGQRGQFHISHDASRLISVFSSRWKERSRVSREIFNDPNFKMQLIQGAFQ